MLTTLAFLAALAPGAQPVTLKLVPSGASEKTGARQVMADLAAAPTAKGAPADLVSPEYGTIVAGAKKLAFVTDAKGRLIVDANGDGDLSNDPAVDLKPLEGAPASVTTGTAMVDIGKDVPVGIRIIRFDPANPPSPRYKDKLLYTFDYGYEIGFKLDGKPFTSFIGGEPGADSTVQIDRNGDGKISYFKEVAKVGKPFNFTGTTYVFEPTATGLVLETAKETLPMAPMPPNLNVGQPTLPIRATALDGKPVDLGSDYKGKLVMVDFWATWCGPCMRELPNVKAAYAENHAKGFEILGISFDKAEYGADKLKAFTAEKGMPWRQVYEGKFWNTSVGEAFDVAAIPFTLLIDGDTGRIVAEGDELRGPKLGEFIAHKLDEKRIAK